MITKILKIPILIATILTYTMSNASQWQNNSVQPLAIMDAKGKQPITMLNYCSIPHLAANSGFIKGYFNFYEQDENTARNKLIPKLLATLQNSQTDEPISLNEAAQRIVALEQLIKHYAKKDIPNLTKLIASKNNDEISKLLQTANFLTLPEKFMGHLALPLAKAWGPYIKNPAFEEQIKIAAQLLGGSAEVHQIPRPIKVSEQLTLQGHTQRVKSANFSPDGSKVVTVSDETVKIWDVETGQCLHTLTTHSINSGKFSPDGTTIIMASERWTTEIWNVETGTRLHKLGGHLKMVFDATFSPDGTKVITASGDKRAIIWDAKTGDYIGELQGHTKWVKSATFSPDGTKVVTASWDGTAKIWVAKTGELLRTLQGHTAAVPSATFSPDGTKVVTASGDETAKIWDVETGQCLSTLKHGREVSSATFSPNGITIVTACWDGVPRIWDAVTGECLHAVIGLHWDLCRSFKYPVLYATFSPDSSKIVTASDDKTAKIWNLEYPKVTGAEYILYHTFRHSGLQKLQLQQGSYLAKIIEKLNSRFPKDQPAIPLQLVAASIEPAHKKRHFK